ncbi:13732_t:CDS:2, partial [Racocetra persica]
IAAFGIEVGFMAFGCYAMINSTVSRNSHKSEFRDVLRLSYDHSMCSDTEFTPLKDLPEEYRNVF